MNETDAPNAQQDLLNYIQMELARGALPADIAATLQQNGWPVSEIITAFQQLGIEVPGMVQGTNTESAKILEPSSRWARFWASVIDDFLIMIIILLLVFVPIMVSQGKLVPPSDDLTGMLLTIVVIIIGTSYHVGFLYKKGTTPGKKNSHLKVVVYETGERPTLYRILARQISYGFFALPYLGGLLSIVSNCMILFTKERRGIPDRIAGTWVVKE